jgi:hypothetical protein
MSTEPLKSNMYVTISIGDTYGHSEYVSRRLCIGNGIFSSCVFDMMSYNV